MKKHRIMMAKTMIFLLPSLLVFCEQQSSSLHKRGSGWPFWYENQRHQLGPSTPSSLNRQKLGQKIVVTERTAKLLQNFATSDSQASFQRRIASTMAPYTRHHPGRRVCSAPVTSHHHRGNQIRLVYTDLQSGYICCPGWTQVTRSSYGCNKPVCHAPCQNGGFCNDSGFCSCSKGFTGSQCQTDIDECVMEKPCAQICRNLMGSYECHCRTGFDLQNDGQSCKKNASEGTAFEAGDLERDYGVATTTRHPIPRDTENEVGENGLDQDYEVILRRLNKLEKQIARGKKKESENDKLSSRIDEAFEDISQVKKSVTNMHQLQHEVYTMRNQIKQFEIEARKIQHLANRIIDLENRMRLRCRSNIIANRNF